jgi:Fe-S-cluster-containing dehydrogenase component
VSISRRAFLRGTALTGAAASVVTAKAASAREPEAKAAPENALGMLFDSTLCVGCKACMVACRQANGTHPEITTKDPLWDAPLDLSANTLTVIKAWSSGAAEHKDDEADGYAFVKKSCLHCVEPACVSVCPVSAMTKDPKTGVVHHNPKACIGCRYCVAACPFGVPRFDFDKSIARLNKCELCESRRAEGKITACADVCPTGATLFGTVSELAAEADRRHRLKPGEPALYPRRTVNSGDVHEKPAPHYQPRTYGAREVGGTQVQLLSAVSYNKLGYPTLPDKPFVETSEEIQHSLYKGMIAPAVLFGVLLILVNRAHDHGSHGADGLDAHDLDEEAREGRDQR